MSPELVQPGVNVIGFAQFFKHRQKVEQLGVVHVVKPRYHRNLKQTERAVTHTDSKLKINAEMNQ